MVSKGYMIAGIGAVACLLGFFLPWISILGITVSGWQATFGYSIGGFNVGGGNFLYVLVLLAPFAVGYLLYNSFKKGGILDKNLDAYGLIGIGVVVLLLLLVAASSIGFGWILCFLSAVAIGVAGYFNLKQLQTGRAPF